jgi:hypothetical protein
VEALKTNIGDTHAKATAAEAKLSAIAESEARTLEHSRGWGCDLSVGLCARLALRALIIGRAPRSKHQHIHALRCPVIRAPRLPYATFAHASLTWLAFQRGQERSQIRLPFASALFPHSQLEVHHPRTARSEPRRLTPRGRAIGGVANSLDHRCRYDRDKQTRQGRESDSSPCPQLAQAFWSFHSYGPCSKWSASNIGNIHLIFCVRRIVRVAITPDGLLRYPLACVASLSRQSLFRSTLPFTFVLPQQNSLLGQVCVQPFSGV